jgi:small subunit ribosomal protein S21
MLVINVKEDESIDRALKRYKRKFQSTKMIKELRKRKHYVKPSVSQEGSEVECSLSERRNLVLLNFITQIYDVN